MPISKNMKISVAPLVEQVRKAVVGKNELEWAPAVAEIVERIDDVRVLAALFSRLQAENATLHGSIWIAGNIVAPRLQALASVKQLSAARLSFLVTSILATLAVIFGAVQAYYAYVGAHCLK
jgi:hypothetical protein